MRRRVRAGSRQTVAQAATRPPTPDWKRSGRMDGNCCDDSDAVPDAHVSYLAQ